ncbi:MAG: hypothetical protein RLZZ142_889 [Verrucomicrobiota bacterium]|jgi:chorismate-pyruvate lyase
MTMEESGLLRPLVQLHGPGSGVFESITGEEMPEPYRGLLVHGGDMTSRLEGFHGGAISLQVLQCRREGASYAREVVLRRVSDGGAVEYGAIEIELDAFSEELRVRILEGRVPLGGLLNASGVLYHSEPQAFFRVFPGEFLSEQLGAERGEALYGRCNVLRHDDGVLIARIVEVLPRG